MFARLSARLFGSGEFARAISRASRDRPHSARRCAPYGPRALRPARREARPPAAPPPPRSCGCGSPAGDHRGCPACPSGRADSRPWLCFCRESAVILVSLRWMKAGGRLPTSKRTTRTGRYKSACTRGLFDIEGGQDPALSCTPA
jgi:hypothetical protein